jgi:hypothetical protein
MSYVAVGHHGEEEDVLVAREVLGKLGPLGLGGVEIDERQRWQTRRNGEGVLDRCGHHPRETGVGHLQPKAKTINQCVEDAG